MSNVLKILGGKYPKGTVVSYPKAGNRPAYEATVSPSGRFVPKGYQEGSMVEDSLMGMMGGGMANKAMKGYREGGGVLDTIKGLFANLGRSSNPMVSQVKSDMPLMEEQIDAPMIDMDAVLAKKKMQDDAAFSIIPTVGEFKGQRIYQGSPEMSSYLDSDAHSQYIKSKFNFKQGGMIGPLLPPEMMGQAMNQQLSDSIDMRMQNPQAGEIGMVRKESDAIEAAMKDNLARNARLALQKMKLDSILSEQNMVMPSNQEMERSTARDLVEFFKMQTMQRGRDAVMEGMGDQPMRLLR